MTCRVNWWHGLQIVLLSIVVITLAVPTATPKDSAVKLGIQVFENLEGYHTQTSELGTRLGKVLMSALESIDIDDQVPLQSNETVRILDEMTKGRKVIVTTLHALSTTGGVNYPTIVFADDAIKFADLTWKLDEDAALKRAKAKGMTHCLTGVCTGLVTVPHEDTAAGKRNLSSITANINLRLHDLSTGKTVWMNTYQQVVAHSDPRLAFIQALEDIAPTIASDLQSHFDPQE